MDVKITRYAYLKIHDTMNRTMKKVVTFQSKSILYYQTQIDNMQKKFG